MNDLDQPEPTLWKERFRAPAIFNSQIAHEQPERGLVAGNQSGAIQYYTWDTLAGALRQLTDTEGGHAKATVLSPDGEWVYWLDDEGGNEVGHYVRVPYDDRRPGEREPEDITPSLPDYSSFSLEISRGGNRIVFMGAGDWGYRVYSLPLRDDGRLGDARVIYESEQLAWAGPVTADGTLAIVSSTERTGRPQYSLIAIDTESGQQVAELWEGGEDSLNAQLASPLPGDPRIVATTTRTGRETLLIWNPRTGERVDLEIDLPGSLGALDWSPAGSHLLVRSVHEAQHRLHMYDLRRGGLVEVGAREGIIAPAHFSPSGELIYGHWQDATHPAQLVAFDATTGAEKGPVLQAADALPGRALRSVHFPSPTVADAAAGEEESGTRTIQGWLATPDGDGPFPTILNTHGGPQSVAVDSYRPSAQAWLDHGFAYLTVNYTGSVTFGRDFEQAIWGNPGFPELEDMAAARAWLVSEGIADPATIFLEGGSYGGYLTLMGLGRQPALWAAGMAVVAIADWAVQYEDSGGALRGYIATLLGGTPEEAAEQYRASSPVTYAEQVQAPVLIIQGRNDSRTPARPVEQYVARLEEMNHPVELHWFDAGHAGPGADTARAIANQELMLDFARRVLEDK